MIPNDPIMLLSYVNTKLRDFYTDLDSLCDDLELQKEELIEKMLHIDYRYDDTKNQFL